MDITEFTTEQQFVKEIPFGSKTLLEGPAGSGKTTAAVERLKLMVGNGVPARSILVLVPQRSLGIPYVNAIRDPGFPAGGEPAVVTLGGLAQRMLTLFWPLISKESGFGNPTKPPQYLTLEAAQYYLARVIQPLLQKGYFENVTVDPNRLYSQILDNLNKSAVVGFPISQIGERLRNAWVGSPSQLLVYDQAQECAKQFRDYCLKNNLLDFSLQFELFSQKLWNTLLCQEYLVKNYRHLIYDNIEEDVPVAHDLIHHWLPRMESALIIRDGNGGLRSFLGADPRSADAVVETLPEKITFSHSLVQEQQITAFSTVLSRSLREKSITSPLAGEWENAFEVQSFRFYPEMMDWTVEKTRGLLSNQTEPTEIAVLSPFLSDSLRFSLVERFERAGIAVKSFRPSRSLKDEPVTRALLTLAKIAYPHWHKSPTRHEVMQAFAQVLEYADLIRANLLAQTLYQPSKPEGPLISFSQVIPEMQSRITFRLGETYEKLRQWLNQFREQPVNELDIFLSRLFGKLLSQPGFRLFQNSEGASITARLIESARKFRQASQPDILEVQTSAGKEYVTLLEGGLIAAQSISGWKQQMESNAVLIAPAFTFLMVNRPVRYQFWLDIGSHGWWSRLDQPLTQPYVLNRQWNPAEKWTEAFEFAANQTNLERLLSGLLNRCADKVFMGISSMNEQGNEERGELVTAVQTLRRILLRTREDDHV